MKSTFVLLALVVVTISFVVPPQKDSYLSCALCKIAVNVTQQPVDNEVHSVEDEFIAECKKELSGIPFLEQECTNYAHKELDPIIKELESGTAPQDVCNKLNECP